MVNICPKCGKIYKRDGKYWEEHLEKCTRKESKTSSKPKLIKTIKVKDFNKLFNRLDNFEKRLSILEQKFNKLDLNNIFSLKSQIEITNLPINNDKKLVNIIKDIIIKNSNLYSIKGVIPLEDLKANLSKKYNLIEKEFEEIILKLYRRELVDLQSGGTPNGYHLKSPTGKRFFYLMVKET